MKTPQVLRTDKGNLVCLIEMDETRCIQTLTGKLRTSPLPTHKRLRQLLREKDIDVGRSYLVCFFPEGESLDSGVIVTNRRQIFYFDLDWLQSDIEGGFFSMWREVKEVSQNRWRQKINIAFQLLEQKSNDISS